MNFQTLGCIIFKQKKDKFYGFRLFSLSEYVTCITVLEASTFFCFIANIISNQNTQIIFNLNTTSFIQYMH